MDTLLLVARLVLATVFAVAGVGKLLDLDGSVSAVRGFHLPERLARPIGVGLPVVEIGAALLLLPTGTAWVGALIGATLLVGFLGGMVNSLRLGEAPDCHCFGQIHSEPVGTRAIGRNATLLLVALFILIEGYGDAGTSPFAGLDGLSALEATMLAGLTLLLGAVAAEGWLIAHLLRQSGRLLLAIDELRLGQGSAAAVIAEPVGSSIGLPTPAVSVADLDGRAAPLRSLTGQGKRTVLVFSDPSCGPCAALRPDIHRWQVDHAARLTVMVVSRGQAEANRAHAAEHGVERVYLEQDRAVSAAFGVTGTPAAILLGADGSIESELVGGAAAIRSLVARAAERPVIALNGTSRPPAATLGHIAPVIALPDLDGRLTTVDYAAEGDTVVLLWNPGCGFCQRLAPEILEWEQQASATGTPALRVVSQGSAATNRAIGFRSPVVLDDGFATGRRLGASGTPSAVLVDAAGRIASPVAVGGPAVMRLLSREEAPSTPGAHRLPSPTPQPA